MPFDEDIAVRREEAGVFACEVSPNYQVVAGPNGGYLAALLTRAAEAHLDDSARQLRSLNVHYLRPAKAGPGRIEVTTEQLGRTVAYLRVKLLQNGKPVLLATGAWATPRVGIEYDGWSLPKALPPEDCRSFESLRDTPTLPIHRQWDIRCASDVTFGSGGTPDLSWWIRPPVHRPLDAPLLVAITDALPPPIFVTKAGPIPVPTIDLTVHLRAELAQVAWRSGDFLLARFTTRYAGGGFLEEDGELWTADGTLLAHSRQLALGS